MEKIKFMADAPSDIPDEDLKRYNIDMPSVPITIDGESFFERRSFSITEFYGMIGKAKELPATSRVPADDFLGCYQRAFDEGYTAVICVTINSTGSGTNASAHMAKEMFFRARPEAEGKFAIHIVDSGTYTMAYGYPVVQAAKMAEAGKSCAEILAYLEDWFARVDIYLGCYTLLYAKKSGCINAVAAFVGEMLGLRPIIRLVDGVTEVPEKVRGDKQIIPGLFKTYLETRESREAPVLVACGEDEALGLELKALIEQDVGHEVPMYHAGASIVINAGPKIVAVVCHTGKRR